MKKAVTKTYDVPVANEKELAKIKTLNENDLATVTAFKITNDEEKEGLRELGKSAQARGKMIEALTASGISTLFQAHKQLKAEQNDLVVPTKNIVQIVKDKLGIYKKECDEEQRQVELKRQADEQAKRERVLKAAEKKISGLLEGVTDLSAQRDKLVSELNVGEVSDEEAILMRAQIVVLEEAIESKQEKADLTVAKVEQTAPVSAPVSSAPKPTGYNVEVHDLRALCKAIGQGIAPEGLISKVNETDLKRFRKMGQKYPGVKYTPIYSKARI